jgi:hypothetical protein
MARSVKSVARYIVRKIDEGSKVFSPKGTPLMSFLAPTPEQALLGLRAMKTVVTASAPLDDTRRALIAAVQKHVLNTAHDFDRLDPITPEALAAAFVEPRLRDQLSRGICLQVMIPDSPAAAEREMAERFVHALGGAKESLDRMRSAYEHKMTVLRFDAFRSSFMADSAKRKLKDEGVLGLLANIGEILGVHENAEVAARYRALGELPVGTVGRTLFAFYTERSFPFPGERGGAPESIIAHDLTHVLTGYSTDLPSEACVTAFQAGYRREGPFAGLLFVLMNMEKGVKMTRLAPGATHMFGEPGMADRIVDAWKRGTLVKMDLVAEWDYWKDLPRPLADVRAELGVVVKA